MNRLLLTNAVHTIDCLTFDTLLQINDGRYNPDTKVDQTYLPPACIVGKAVSRKKN